MSARRLSVAIPIFPGTNCDHGAIHAYETVLGCEARAIWHTEQDLGSPDAVVIPGGFAYGDYLRTGALAKISPVMQAVRDFAESGGPVLGICNGFQVLCEVGLLPGVLLPNIGRQFLSQFLHIRVEKTETPFTKNVHTGDVVCCPVAHNEGNYFIDDEGLKRLEGEGQVVFRYCDARGEVSAENRVANPNGSRNAIAGVCNARGNVVGLMPHPERAVDKIVSAPCETSYSSSPVRPIDGISLLGFV